MKSRYEHNGIVWLDLENPTRHEVIDVAAEFGLDTLTAEELLQPSIRPHVDIHPSYAYLVLHFPALRHSHKSREQEIDFIIGERFLITTHYDTIDPLHKFSKVFEVNSTLDSNMMDDHAGYIFFFLLKKLYKAVEHEVEFVKRDLFTIEEHIYSAHQVEMVTAISHAARDLLNLRQTIEPHRDVLKSLETEGAAFFGDEFRQYLRSLENDYYRVHNHIMRNTESLHELRETNNSLLTTKQNETIKVLTLVTVLIIPLSFIAELFAMDTKHMPIIGAPFDFWIILGLMALTCVLFYLYFRYKKWL